LGRRGVEEQPRGVEVLTVEPGSHR
jgi:hypothetical protein